MVDWEQAVSNISGVRTDDTTKSFTATTGDVGFDSETKASWIRVSLTGLNSSRIISPIDSLWTIGCRYVTDNETASYQCRYDMHTDTHVLFEIKK
jgi:hypothetical protein